MTSLPRKSSSPWLILIVEDEELVRLLAVEYFTDVGFQVIEAGDAAHAVHLIDQALHELGLVFTDIQMPGEMDGIALALHMQHRLPEIPVILTSGGLSPSLRDHAANRRFVRKPYQLTEVERHIRELLPS